MKIFIVVMMIFGLFEILSNLFHLSKKNITGIAASGRKQHQELDLGLSDYHFFYKVMIMFIIGMLFSISSLLAFLNICSMPLFVSTMILGFYGVLQAVLYRKNIKAWSAMIVYNIPLIIYIFLTH
ncbi:MAG: hypothetical protein KAZ87_14820 [Spirochaetes bacterium]|nr:hypothetical protein [Spirochaetota bacterium]